MGQPESSQPAAISPVVGQKMSALVLEEPGLLRVCEVDVPLPGPGEILIRVRAATTCGTDLKAYLRGHPQIPMPGIFGHEYSGTVVAVGEGAPFAIGTDVMGVHSAPCQTCFWCESNQENLCERIMETKVLGSYAEYLLIPAHIARLNVFEKPASVSFARAALLEPLACVAQGILELGSLMPYTRVLIIGPGAIGLMFVAALRQLGIHDVTLAGRNKRRLAVGEQLGARPLHVSDVPHSLGRGYDVVIECTGNVEVWQSSIHYARRGGRVMLFGGCPAGTHAAFDTQHLHYQQITILSPFHFGTRAVQTAREWLLDPNFHIEAVISGQREIADAEQVFADLQSGNGIKYLFRP
ncbi:MAG: alcohol dehydrogenase catalytic domain-containing protein [Chthonomonas sp.]|nr:alcohol dehydrogenase catalytic domain-containing protein [Chthonomonas sp.]